MSEYMRKDNMVVFEIDNKKEYDFFSKKVNAHFLQSYEWGEFKKEHGWEPVRIGFFKDEKCIGVGQYLKRKLFFNYYIAYFPKGPSFQFESEPVFPDILEMLKEYFKDKKDILFFRIEPDIVEHIDFEYKNSNVFELLKKSGYIKAPYDIQYRDTRKLILSDEESVWSSFSSNHRNKIRKASKKGIEIREVTDESEIEEWYGLYEITAKRNNIFIHNLKYYKDFFSFFYPKDVLKLYASFYNGEMITGAYILYYGDEAIYMYGASQNKERNRHPNEALFWEAIKEAIRKKKKYFDFWGIAPNNDSSHPWYGLSQFKARFGGVHIRYGGCYDYPNRKMLYHIFITAEKVRKYLLQLKKRLKKK